MMNPILAYLMVDGIQRQVCVGCTHHLAECAMVTKIEERDLHELYGDLPAGKFSAVTYEIAAPFTLEQCRAWVADRHGANGEAGSESPH